MSDTKRQHYVPKSYLKEFGIQRELGTKFSKQLSVWTQEIGIARFAPELIQIGNKICAEDYFYRINTNHSFINAFFGDNHNIDNPNIIEDLGFSYENELPALFKKLKHSGLLSGFSISKKDMETLSYAMVDIKWRNPFIRKIFNINDIGSLIDEERKELLKIDGDIFKLIDAKINHVSKTHEEKEMLKIAELAKISSKFLQDLGNPDELIKVLHSMSSYKDGLKGQINDMRNDLIERFINCRWSIIQTDTNNQFITSDNPGIFLSSVHIHSFITVKQIEESKFSRFIFPLSGQHGLLIELFVPDRESTLFEKKINIMYSPQSILEYNSAHCAHVNKILIASNKQALKKAWEKGKDSWINK